MIQVVDKIINKVKESVPKIPYEIKFILKLVSESSNLSDEEHFQTMADLLCGTWLSCGFKWPE